MRCVPIDSNRHADEIEAGLTAEYDNIENRVDLLSGWTVDADDK